MIQGHWASVAAAAKVLKINVEQKEWAKTTEETVPVRPTAVTAPVAAPKGAIHLGSGLAMTITTVVVSALTLY